MVALDVRFKCDSCLREVVHTIRIGPNFFLGADQMPEGWRLDVQDEYTMRCFCPEHSGGK